MNASLRDLYLEHSDIPVAANVQEVSVGKELEAGDQLEG